MKISNNSLAVGSVSALFLGAGLTLLISVLIAVTHTVSVSAAIPKGFASKDACLAQVSAAPIEEVVAFGNERAENRTKTLGKYKAQVEKQYATYDKRLSKAEAAYKKKTGSAPSGEAKNLAKNSKDALLKNVADAAATLSALKTEFDQAAAAKDQAVLADRTCRMIYDLQLYSFFNKKLKAQYAVDGLHNLNAVNGYHRESTIKLNEKNGGKASDVSGMPNPSSRVGSIDALQPKVEAITVAAATAQPDKDLFKDLNASIVSTKKTIVADQKAIAKVSQKITKVTKKKAPKKAKSQSSSGSSSSSSSSSGSSAASSSSSSSSGASTKTTAAKKTEKKPAKKAAKKKTEKKCSKGQRLVKNVNGASVYDYCEVICINGEVRSAINYKNCVCPKDHRYAPGKTRKCVHKSDPVLQKSTPCPSGQKRLTSGGPCVIQCIGIAKTNCWKP